MALSYDLLSQFAKIVNQDKKTSNESTVYGKVVVDGNGNKYVQLDGSDQLTPLGDTSANVAADDRISVLIKNHTATVTGNISSPAAGNQDIENAIDEFDILVGDRIEANTAYIKNLIADEATIGQLEAAGISVTELIANEADIAQLVAGKITVTDLIASKIDADVVSADYATIESLNTTNANVGTLAAAHAEFRDVTLEKLDAQQAVIQSLDSTYANIDFANITELAVDKFYAVSGIIDKVTISEGVVVKELVGVTISGDLIKANTIMAENLVVRGSDGNLYKLNTDFSTLNGVTPLEEDSIHGSNIIANSITAEQISVDDLVAFDATIGGFNITDQSLYSGVKSSVDNSTRGIYLGTDAQFNIGDANNFIRYIQVPSAKVVLSDNSIVVTEIEDEDGPDISASISDGIFHLVSGDETPSAAAQIMDNVFNVYNDVYRLEISAESIIFGADSRSSAADLKKLTEHVKIGTVVDEETGDEKPCVELAEGDSNFKQVITNTKTQFMDGAVVKTTIDTDGIETDNITVKNEFRHGGFVWASRPNGNYGLSWVKGVTS